jgi:hypothetical protein
MKSHKVLQGLRQEERVVGVGNHYRPVAPGKIWKGAASGMASSKLLTLVGEFYTVTPRSWT